MLVGDTSCRSEINGQNWLDESGKHRKDFLFFYFPICICCYF